jgi:hypothetical protein
MDLYRDDTEERDRWIGLGIVERAYAIDEELDARIKEKLGRYMGAVDVVDVEEIEVKITSTAELAQQREKITEEPSEKADES